MMLVDTNVLVNAHRPEANRHAEYRDWLQDLINSPQPYAVSDFALIGMVRSRVPGSGRSSASCACKLALVATTSQTPIWPRLPLRMHASSSRMTRAFISSPGFAGTTR
jgi:predicted nucleic acid-binding protein